jgi:hypothetical protein
MGYRHLAWDAATIHKSKHAQARPTGDLMKIAHEAPFRSNVLRPAFKLGVRTTSFLLPCLLLALTGCGMGPVTNGPTPGGLVSGLSGVVHGGQSPVTSSLIRLMAPGTTGYGSAPSVLATTTSNSVTGAFTLPTYTCPTPDQLVYIEASGGNPGAGTNVALDEVALLGNCSTLSGNTKVVISEVTTVAAAYALAPFASVTATTVNIGTTSTNITGLNNAFGPANNLVSYSTGVANGTTALPNMVLPTQLLNTIANILSACVNTTVSTPTACSTLFSDTTVGGVAPINTFQAALNIALHPGANVSGTTGLYSLASTSPPFQPAMTSASAPNDFTLAIGYTNAGIATYGTIDIAIDSKGNAWVSDFNTTSTLTGLIEISPAGVFLSPANGFGTSTLKPSVGIGVDQNGLIWVANNNGSADTAFNPDGSVYGNYTGIIGPNGLAIDGKGDIWTSTGGTCCNTFQELVNNLPTGYTLAPSFTASSVFGTGICITPTTLYVTGAGHPAYGVSPQVTIVNLSNTTVSGTITPDSGGASLSGCAVDHAGRLYLPDNGAYNGVEVYSSAGALVTQFAVPTNATYYPSPQEMVVDGLGNSLVTTYTYYQPNNGATNYPAGFFTFNSSGTLTSPTSGYYPITGASSASGYGGFAGLTPVIITDPGGVAVDGSGNLWFAGTNNGSTLPNYVTEVIGIAAPVVTPKATAITNNTTGLRP